MPNFRSLRDLCSYNSWNSIGHKSVHSDPIWWNYIPSYGMLEKSGSAMPPVYFKGVKSIMKDARSSGLKLYVVNGRTDDINYNISLPKDCIHEHSTLKNKIYELNWSGEYEIN